MTTKPEETAIAIPPPMNVADSMFALIQKVASDPNADAAKAKAFLDMQILVMDKQAHIDFAAAKARIKEKLQHIKIVKNKTVGYDKVKGDPSKGRVEAFKFAALEDIEKITTPLLTAEGISDSYTMEPLTSGWYNVKCRLSKGTYTEETCVPLPLDTSGGKNNVQGAGSSFSYGRRYSLTAALGIVVIGQDDDGAGGVITEEQAKELKELLPTSKLDVKKFLIAVNAESVDEIKTKDFARALNSIQAAIYRENEKAAKKKGADNA